MLRFKVVLLSVFAVVAFSAIASASASATDTCTGGLKLVFCTFPGNQPIHSLGVSGTSGLSLLATKVGITEVKIHCPDDTFSGTLKLLGLAEGEISFLGCTVVEPANCSTTSLIGAFVHIQVEAGLKGTATGNKTSPLVPEEFASVTLNGGSCSIAGAYTVSGLQELTFPNGELGSKEHEIVAKKAGSKLKFGAEIASFSSTAKVHLDSNEEWLIMKGE